ncbi:hypothetical protein WQQ_13040 [Hydrocarboniphaga effusa AP103]|uniref:Uncharacterized protein n=1 Tax=Hydrocarboniphaga effusa AP103 TaxID=1172194 RepID=I7ZHF4_9GAMM|nr:hypothetical protein WQQ_13040 [Hydrocarboniphaga effusa AP103]
MGHGGFLVCCYGRVRQYSEHVQPAQCHIRPTAMAARATRRKVGVLQADEGFW